MTEDRSVTGPYLKPGPPVLHDGLVRGGPEYGIVVHCWLDDEIGAYDCYVAFSGDRPPQGKPVERPYVLRYASLSLSVIEATDGSRT